MEAFSFNDTFSDTFDTKKIIRTRGTAFGSYFQLCWIDFRGIAEIRFSQIEEGYF